jgi:uncharacterized protein (DUF433 family)
MTALEEVRNALKRLSLPEKQKVLEELTFESVEVGPGVFKTVGVCGGDARIRQMRLPVWQLEESRRNGATNEQLLKAYPQLTPTDLTNAWAYVAAHLEEIETAIRENNEV